MRCRAPWPSSSRSTSRVRAATEAWRSARAPEVARCTQRSSAPSERLSLAEDGRVVYRLRSHRRDGTRAVVFAPLDFIARLAALVPRPGVHLLTYHGVLAPAEQWRDRIVPGDPRSRHAPLSSPADPRRPAQAKRRATWAELLKRVFEIDVLTCPWCGGQRRLIALISDGAVVRRILAHLGLPTTAPALDPARSPPELDFAG